MRKIFLVLVLILVCGCSNNSVKESMDNNIEEPIEQTVDTINSVREHAKKRSAELVFVGVEYAYTSAMYGGISGSSVADPDLEDIKDHLNIDNMSGTPIIKNGVLTITTNDGVTCTVTVNASNSSTFDVACGENGELLSKTIPALAE